MRKRARSTARSVALRAKGEGEKGEGTPNWGRGCQAIQEWRMKNGEWKIRMNSEATLLRPSSFALSACLSGSFHRGARPYEPEPAPTQCGSIGREDADRRGVHVA